MNQILESARMGSVSVVAVLGDITVEAVDAIVNAANSRLLHGGGVAGAISRAGGHTIQDESLQIAPIATGKAGITKAGTLAARYVIHAVGPVWGGGKSGEPKLLDSAVRESLLLASNKGLNSISIPTISAGVFGFPPLLAVDTIFTAVTQFVSSHPETTLKEIRFCNIQGELAQAFAEKVAAIKQQ